MNHYIFGIHNQKICATHPLKYFSDFLFYLVILFLSFFFEDMQRKGFSLKTGILKTSFVNKRF